LETAEVYATLSSSAGDMPKRLVGWTNVSELRMLPWEDVDLERGLIYIHCGRDRNTGEEKSSIEPALLALFRAMHRESDGTGAVIDLWSERTMAHGFRRWLARAG
jgi:hypothetical protein